MNEGAATDGQCAQVISTAAAVTYSSNDGAVSCKRLLQANNSNEEGGNQLLESRSMKIQNNLCTKIENDISDARKFCNLPKLRTVEITFTNLSYSVREGCMFRKKGQKSILKCLHGHFKSREFVGILGPSGAGKSSLMNLLTGHRESGMEGEIMVNGIPRNSRAFRKMSCYIMQDDMLLPHLTVMEAMMISAGLKLDQSTSSDTKKSLVTEILSSLGLMSCKKTKSSDLSGGQRKRLAIAQELVSNPPIMFFDEPTSGLDSVSSFQVLSLLKSLAKGGRTVICTIHQPSAKLFEMFDKLYILGEGQCIYRGSVPGLLPFLRDHGFNCPKYHNPADYVIEVAAGDYGEANPMLVQSVNSYKCDYYAKHTDAKGNNIKEKEVSGEDELSDVDVTATASSPEKVKDSPQFLLDAAQQMNNNVDCDVEIGSYASCGANCWSQFFVLFKRAYICIIRDQVLTHLRLGSHVLVGVMIGLLYHNVGKVADMNNPGCLFFSLLFVMFAALMPTTLTFPLEMTIFIREHMNYWYSVKSYYIARTLADVPFQILFPIIYAALVYWLTGQPWEPGRFTLFSAFFVMTSIVAQSSGLLIGAAATSLEVATFVAPITTIPVLLFSGFFVRLESIPWYLRWLSYASYVRYSFSGTLIAIYGLNRTELECKDEIVVGCPFTDPKRFLYEMDVSEDELWLDFGILAIYFVGLRLITYIVLRLRVRLEK